MEWKKININATSGAKAPIILLSVALVSVFLSYLSSHLLQDSWQYDPIFLHSALEGACISVAVFTFLIMWQNYERSSNINQIVGFGFLLVGIFDFLHTYFYPSLNHHPLGYNDISSRYWVLGRITEAVILLLGTLNIFEGPKKRSVGLIITIVIGLTVSYVIYARQDWFPVLLTNNGGVTTVKIIIEYFIIGLFLLNLLLLYSKIKTEEYLTEKYLFVALIIAVPAEICFASYHSLTSFDFTFGHILKVVYYLFLYKGLFASTVTHPYIYYETILNELPIGIINYDRHEKIRFVNNEAARLIGVNPSEIIGLSAFVFEKTFYKNGDKSSIRDVKNGANRFTNVFRTIEKGSEKIDLEVSGFRFSQGGWLVYFNDAKVAHLFENLQLQTKTILNSMDSLVLVSDASDRVTMCNNSFIHLTGLTELEVLNEKVSKVQALLGLSLSKPSKIKESHEGREGSFLSMDGVKRDIIFNLNSVHGINGNLIGNVAVATDISSTIKETERLRQQEKLAVLGQMAAGLVHEIRNPLTTIKGFSQIISTKVEDERTKTFADIIVQTSDELNEIITDFLVFAKPRLPVFVPQKISNLLSSLWNVIQNQLLLKNIPFTIELPEQDKEVLIDEAQVKQVILNITKNAIEAVAEVENPFIAINAFYDSRLEEMVIRISDNGYGISNETKSKLGTPFFSSKDKGTGLGLSICYQIIKEHNGRIEIESVLDKGCVFRIVLPCIVYQENDKRELQENIIVA